MALSFQIFIRKLILIPVYLYKNFISPALPKACLYEPSCSRYLIDSVLKFGIFKGFYLGFFRIIRCNAWFFKGGDDPVPELFSLKHPFTSMRYFYKHKKRPPDNGRPEKNR